MTKTFDNLFDDFIKDDETDSLLKRSSIKKIIETIVNFKKLNIGDVSEEQLDMELGEPTTTEEYIEDGLKYVRMIWKTSEGEFIKIIMTEILPEIVPVKTLEDLLAEAVAVEDYGLAIKLRDEIKNRSEKK
jgi:hypothetical protein